jgi:hypothetical protein
LPFFRLALASLAALYMVSASLLETTNSHPMVPSLFLGCRLARTIQALATGPVLNNGAMKKDRDGFFIAPSSALCPQLGQKEGGAPGRQTQVPGQQDGVGPWMHAQIGCHLLFQFIKPIFKEIEKSRIGHGLQLPGPGYSLHKALTHLRWIDTFVQALGQSEIDHAGDPVVAGLPDEPADKVETGLFTHLGQKVPRHFGQRRQGPGRGHPFGKTSYRFHAVPSPLL